MKEPFKRARLPRHPTVWWSRIKTKWPFLVWIAAIVGASYFYAVGVDLAAFVGHVEAIDLPIAPAEDSRVECMLVQLGDIVTNDQPIAIMNSSHLDAEIAVNEALATENTASATARILSLYNGYQQAVSDAESQLSSEIMAQGEAQGELTATTAELVKLRKLIDDGMVTADSTVLTRLVTQEATLQEAIRLYPESIRSIEERLARARSEFASFREWLGVESNAEVTAALIAQIRQNVGSPTQQIALLKQRKEHYTLRASQPGTIAHFYERPGNVLARGVPVATVIVASDRVVGFLPETFAHEPTLGMKALVFRRSGDDRDPIHATVDSMSPRIEGTTISGPTGQSLRGRRVYLTMNEGHGLLPGETVDIQLISRATPWLQSLRDLGAPVRALFRQPYVPGEEAK